MKEGKMHVQSLYVHVRAAQGIFKVKTAPV